MKIIECNEERERVSVCVMINSGTTGPPKAVMLSHDNITWTSYITSSMFNLTSTDVLISYLPLSHVAAQVTKCLYGRRTDHYFPKMIDIHGPVTSGCSIFFARPDALKGSLVETLKDIRPTKFLGVPRYVHIVIVCIQ